MLIFILCIERYIHFPPEIYRLLATYLYYKQHWPDVNIKQYNKVMKQLPYPVRASAPCIIYQTGTDYYDGNHHFANNANEWRCCKFRYEIFASSRYLQLQRRFSITEYLPFCQCRYVNGVNEADFTIYQMLVPLTGSAILPLAFVKGQATPEDLYEAANVEENYRAEIYNEDFYGTAPHQEQKHNAMRRDLKAAREFLDFLKS